MAVGARVEDPGRDRRAPHAGQGVPPKCGEDAGVDQGDAGHALGMRGAPAEAEAAAEVVRVSPYPGMEAVLGNYGT